MNNDVYAFPKTSSWEYLIETAKVYDKYPYEIKKQIMDSYRKYKNGILFNSKLACINCIETNSSKIVFHLSQCDFYDFLLSNMLINQIDEFCAFLRENNNEKIISLIREHISFCDKTEYKSFEDLINSNDYVNAVAVSLLVKDSKDNYLLTKRNAKTILAANYYGVSVTGSVDLGDLGNLCEFDPFIRCAKRELKEELGLEIEDSSFIIRGMVAGKQKCQPIVMIDVALDYEWDTVKEKMLGAPDFYSENSNYFLVDEHKLYSIASSKEMTEAARYHILGVCENKL